MLDYTLGRGAIRVLDPREFRFRYLVWIALAAVLTAAVLRHVLHVYGGFSPDDIRSDTLIALAAIALALLARSLFRRAGRR